MSLAFPFLFLKRNVSTPPPFIQLRCLSPFNHNNSGDKGFYGNSYISKPGLNAGKGSAGSSVPEHVGKLIQPNITL